MSSSNASPESGLNWNDSILMTIEEKQNTTDEEDDDEESTDEVVMSKAGRKLKSKDSDHSPTTKKSKKTTKKSSKSKSMKDKGDKKKEQGRKRKATFEEDEDTEEEEEDDSDDDLEDRRKKKKKEVAKKKTVQKQKAAAETAKEGRKGKAMEGIEESDSDSEYDETPEKDIVSVREKGGQTPKLHKMNETVDEVVKPRRGRPPKNKNGAAVKKKVPVVPRKRGRPPKKSKKRVLVEKEKGGETSSSEEDDDDDEDDDESEEEEVQPMPVKKMRGRPSKKLKKTVEEEQENDESNSSDDNDDDDEDEDEDEEIAVKAKKIGRPSKSAEPEFKEKSNKEKKPGDGKEKVPQKTQTKTPIPTPLPKILKFMSKSNKKIYLLPNPKGTSPLPQSAFLSWCFKTGKWLDSRLGHHPNPNYTWSSILESERIEYFTVVILDDKEVKMIERMLGGKRGEGVTEYEHLTEICNLEDVLIRAYVELGKKVEGHPFIDIVHVADKDLEPKKKDSKKSTVDEKSTDDDSPTEPTNNNKTAEDEIKDFSKLFKGPPLIYTGSKSDGVSLKDLTKICLKKGLGDISPRALESYLKKNTGKTQSTGAQILRDGVKRGLVGWKIGGFGEKKREVERSREK